MTIKQQLSNFEKGRVIGLRETGNSIRKIAKILNIPKTTIWQVINKQNTTGTTARSGISGRRKKLNAENLAYIEKIVRENPKKSAPKISAEIKRTFGIKITGRTIRNNLRDMGYKARVACKKPLLREQNKIARLSICKEWLFKPESFWDDVIWSDECKFNLFQSDGRCFVYRKDGTRLEDINLSPTVKFGGGSVIVWACFNTKGVGNLVFIDGIMDKQQYLSILVNNLSQSAEKIGISDWIFQQDNDPKHTAGLIKEFFERKKNTHTPLAKSIARFEPHRKHMGLYEE